jgi:hypothetical protein
MPALIDEEKKLQPDWLARLYARLEMYEDADPKLFVPVLGAFCFYALIALAVSSRPLWHDELYTYYIAKAPTLKQFIAGITQIDLQPPLQYVLSRISLSILGDSAFATRLPSMVAFAVASLCLYYFVRHRLGRFYGLAAMLILWLSPFLYLAGEARPYGLVLGFFGIAMLGWQTAIEGRRRRLGLLALAVGVWGMIVSQAFSPLLVAIFAVAEFARSLERRRVDWPVWIALLAPSPFVVLYIPIFRRFEGLSALPPQFQASYFKMLSFYAELLASVGVVLLIGMTLALLAYRSQAGKFRSETLIARRHEIALVLGLLSLPIMVNLLLMRSGGAFWPRYCMPTAIGFSLLFVYVLAKLTNSSRAAAAIIAGCALLGIIIGTFLQVVGAQKSTMVRIVELSRLDSRLPLVDASGLTFLEMNKREDETLLSRVFYLTDRDAAIKYSHATIFEGTGKLKQYWPIRGTVKPYREFVQQTRHFYVLGTPDYPEDWLIPKLIDDRAELKFIGEVGGSYRDHMIFEVTIPADEAPK